MKKVLVTILIFSICIGFSSGILGMEDNPGADKIIVDKEDNELKH